LEALAVGVFHGGGLEDDAEVLAETALDRVVKREVEYGVGGFAGDDAAAKGILCRLRAILSGGVVEALLGAGDGGAIGGGAGTAGLLLLRRSGRLGVPLGQAGSK
jgi:hypothetical protein